MQAGTRAAVYRRVSTTKQSKEDRYSLPDQLERCTRHLRSLGYEVIQDYCDTHTGTELDERPAMTALREAIRKREIDAVCMTVLDRMSRDQNHQSVVLYEMDKYGVQLLLTDEDFEDTPVGRVWRFLRGMMAEMEHASIKTRTANGRRQRVREGLMIPGPRPLYGYLFADERKSSYVLDPVASMIVQRIFVDVAAGKPLRRIGMELTEDGVPTPTDYWRQQRGDPDDPPQGKPWARSTVGNILHTPAYWGQHSAYRWEYEKRSRVEPETGRSISRIAKKEREIDDGSPRVLLPNAAPPIVSEDIAEAVRRRLEYNQQAATRNNQHAEVALLRGGLAKCALCGHNMVLVWEHRRKHAPYYRCSHSRGVNSSGERCKGTLITVERADAAAWAKVVSVLQDPQTLMDNAKRRMTDEGKQNTIEGYKKSLARLDDQERSLAEAISRVGQNNGYGMDSLLAQLQKVGEQKAEAIKKLKKAEGEYRTWNESQQILDDVKAWCAGAAKHVDDMTYAERRMVLYGFGVRVKVYPHGQTPRVRVRMASDDVAAVVSGEEGDGDEETSRMIVSDYACTSGHNTATIRSVRLLPPFCLEWADDEDEPLMA